MDTFQVLCDVEERTTSAKFIQYEGAGHTPMEEIPDETAHDADLFLSGKL